MHFRTDKTMSVFVHRKLAQEVPTSTHVSAGSLLQASAELAAGRGWPEERAEGAGAFRAVRDTQSALLRFGTLAASLQGLSGLFIYVLLHVLYGFFYVLST